MLRLMLCALLAGQSVSSGDRGDSQDSKSSLAHGHEALRKGFHHKAFKHYREHHRANPQASWSDAALQEGLCVCAAHLKKETVAVSACANATAIRAQAPSPPPSFPLLMAQGEAMLFADQPDEARTHFHNAAHTAARGESVKREKTARAAVKRAEGRIFASFSRQRGAITQLPLRSSKFPTLADALDACATERLCRAISVNLLAASKGSQSTVAATLYNATEVVSDAHKPPSARLLTYVRDAPEHAYAVFPSSSLDTSILPRAKLPGVSSGVPMTVRRAMLLCDAAAQAPTTTTTSPCAGFVVAADDEHIDPKRTYNIEFRSRRKQGVGTGNANSPPSDAVRPARGRVAILREKPTELPPPQPKKQEPKAQPKPGESPFGQRGGSPFGQRGGSPFGQRGGGGGSPFGQRGGSPFGQRGGGGGSPFGQRQPPGQPAKQRRDYYAILKIDKNASPRQVKKAYHGRAKEWHPDRNVDAEPKRKEKADRNFKLIARAYEVLSDKATRRAYDAGEDVDHPKWRPPPGF